jgi:hypothetical protein
MLGNAHPRLMLAHPQLKLKQQLLRSRDGNGKWHENIPILNHLFCNAPGSGAVCGGATFDGCITTRFPRY